MRRIRIISIGRAKGPLAEAAEEYLKRLGRYYPSRETVLKEAPGELAPTERCRREGQAVLAALTPGDLPVALDERGPRPASRELAERLRGWLDDPGTAPCFILGGAYGLSDEVRGRAALTLSLGAMTLPHELARVVLLEQLYRAATILHGHPYHHG